MSESSSNNNMNNLVVILFIILFVVVCIVLFNTYGVKEYIKDEYDKLPPDMQDRIEPFVPISQWQEPSVTTPTEFSKEFQML